jgi:glycogen operon protein
LLVDPYAIELDRRFVYDPALSRFGVDTAALVPAPSCRASVSLSPVRRRILRAVG